MYRPNWIIHAEIACSARNDKLQRRESELFLYNFHFRAINLIVGVTRRVWSGGDFIRPLSALLWIYLQERTRPARRQGQRMFILFNKWTITQKEVLTQVCFLPLGSSR